MTKVRTVMAIILGSMCSAPYAQDSFEVDENDPFLFYGDEETFELATGTTKPLHLAPSVATVIKAKDIETMGARNLNEVMEYVPGLHVALSWVRLKSIYSIRGIHTDNDPQVLFLINGVEVSDLFSSGRPMLFNIPVANISRIEIIRGPGSAVYGADAFSGVINVVTKDADELAGTVTGVRAGSFDSQNVWVQHGNTYAGWKTAVSVEYAKTDGDDERIIDSDLQTVFDGIFSTSASLTPGPATTMSTQLNTSITLSRDNWNIWFNSWNLRDAGIGAGTAQALDPVGRQYVDQYTFALKYKKEEIFEHLAMEAKISHDYSDQQVYFQIFPPNSLYPIGNDGNAFTSGGGLVIFSEGMHGNPGVETLQTVVETAFIYDRLNNHQIRFALGVGHDNMKAKETKNFGPGVLSSDKITLSATPTVVDSTLTDVSGTDNSFLPDTSRTVQYLSMQDEWKFAPDWELTGGIRYDHYSDFGDTTNPRLALVWATDYNLTTKFLYGRAFRAPSSGELFAKNNPAALGNASLEPETIDMAEVVFDYRPTFDIETVVNFYKYQVDGLIDFVNGVYTNVNDQDGHGMEADLVWNAAEKIEVYGNFAWQRSTDSNTGETIAEAPARQASLAMRYKMTSGCSVSPQANWVSDRRRASGDARKQIDDYTIVDITMRCKYSSMPINVAASVRNAFDEDAREPSPYNSALGVAPIQNDFPLEGRSFYIEAAYHFD